MTTTRTHYLNPLRAVVGLAILLSAELAPVCAPNAHAFGCQASGSLPIFPGAAPGFTRDGTTCPTALQIGDNIDIEITLTNTSSSVPPGTAVTAKLVNACVGGSNAGTACTADIDCLGGGTCGAAVAYTFACTTTACSLE